MIDSKVKGSSKASLNTTAYDESGGPAEIPTMREALGYAFRLLQIVRGYWSPFAQALLLGLILGLIGMVIPLLSKLLIDEVYPTSNFTLMHVLVGAILAVSVANAVLGALKGYFTQVVGSQLNAATTLMFFNHIQHLPIRFFD